MDSPYIGVSCMLVGDADAFRHVGVIL